MKLKLKHINVIYLKNHRHPKTNTQMLLYFCLGQPANQTDFYDYNLNNIVFKIIKQDK